MSGVYQEFVRKKLVLGRSNHGFVLTEDKLSDKLHPFQRELVLWALAIGKAALFEDCGLGKAQPLDEIVLTPLGWREIGRLEAGDRVIAADGTATQVTGVFPQGQREIVEIEFNDGARVRCDWEHLWNVQSENDASRGRPWRTMTTRQIAERGLFCTATRSTLNWRIPVMQPVTNEAGPELAVDPYVLGVLLGDGCLRVEHAVTFTSIDADIVREVGRRLSGRVRVVPIKSKSERAPSYRISTPKAGTGHPNPIITALRNMGLLGQGSHGKWIPSLYLLGSLTQRYDLLRGLMDTDGYVAKDGTLQFGSSSRQLAADVVALVRSLGGIAYVSSKMPTYRHRGELRVGLEHYTVTIALPNDVVPFALGRKVARLRKRTKYFPVRKIAAIRPLGHAAAVCISVAHPSQLYVTRDYVVTHNTFQQLEWAKHVAAAADSRWRPGRALILAPLAVSQQTIREGAKFGIEVRYAKDASEVSSPITITNYERLEKFDPSVFAGVVLDESGIIKNYTGKLKQRIFAAFRDTPLKLACTATPAPNDHMELGQHSEFLDVLTSHEMLARWFINDLSAFGTYRLKGHAARDFWDWTCSWARYVGTPADLGYPDDGYQLPGLELHRHIVGVDVLADRGDELFRTPDLSATAVHGEKRRSVAARAARVAELVLAEPNEPWLIWCETDYEEDALSEVLPDAATVNGKDPLEVKEERLAAFAAGGIRHLITKATIAGYGLNFQHCARMAFVGPTFSYERFYQAVRRCHRFGQKRTVHAHVVMGQTEVPVWDILTRKSDDHESMAREMFAATRRATSRIDDRAQPYTPDRHYPLAPWIRTEEAQ